MKLNTLFKQSPCVFSIEVFPPKKAGSTPQDLFPVLAQLALLQPDFMSVTYGAGGGTAGQSTCTIASHLQNTLHIPALAHLTCVQSSRAQVQQVLQSLAQNQVNNVLALRGDLPEDGSRQQDFTYASDLTREIMQTGDFGISGACYPEGHTESSSLTQDVENLHYKIEAGVSHLITQLFFDNGCYYRFLNMARKAGYTLPIQAGVMPIISKNQIVRTVALSCASLPHAFAQMISRYENNPEALFDAGIDYAITQLRDLITGGADGIHLYAMNNPKVASLVYQGIADLLPR